MSCCHSRFPEYIEVVPVAPGNDFALNCVFEAGHADSKIPAQDSSVPISKRKVLEAKIPALAVFRIDRALLEYRLRLVFFTEAGH